MAHAYTPGLRVTGNTVIVKDRRLPLKGEVVVQTGAEVKAEDVVAKTALPGNVKTVNVANQLGIPPGDVPGTMLLEQGAEVAEGDPVAMSKSFFGLFKSTAKASTTGTIENISEITGQVTLREPAVPVEMLAYMDGTVTEVIRDEGVVVETTGAFIQGIFGIGGERVGILKLLVESPEQVLEAQGLGDVAGQVLVVGAEATYSLVMKAKELGAVAVVAGGISDESLRRMLGFDLGVAITGSEDLGITVIVTEGFGSLPIAHKTFDLLARTQGQKTSVNGATQIRAGVMRPEIIVADKTATEDSGGSVVEGGLTEGMTIRVIREPYFGQLGRVTSLPAELVPLETEAHVRVLKVRLEENGAEVVVPRANVEMIES